MKKRMYFLCTGNACRSQMAEGWAKYYADDSWEVYSAGIEAHGVNERAIKAMAEVGIDISSHTSNVIDPELLQNVDVVITLCGDANETCPVTPPHVERIHWDFPDPAKATGTEEEVWTQFQYVRDQIGKRIKQFLEERA